MSFPPRSSARYPVGRPTFIPRVPVAGGPGAALGATAGNLAAIIGGIAGPLLCFGCLATTAILGLFATMIGAAAYMNGIQYQLRVTAQGGTDSGTMMELNFVVLLCTLFCSLYLLIKNQRGTAITS